MSSTFNHQKVELIFYFNFLKTKHIVDVKYKCQKEKVFNVKKVRKNHVA